MSGEKLTRVLVTGGSGFLGSHIADELVHRGHGVVVLDLEAPEAVDREVVIADEASLDLVRHGAGPGRDVSVERGKVCARLPILTGAVL